MEADDHGIGEHIAAAALEAVEERDLEQAHCFAVEDVERLDFSEDLAGMKRGYARASRP